MGFLSNLVGPGPAPPPPLQPVPQPIGVIPYYTQHRGQIALKVRERKMSFSGDDFAVKDAYNGQTMFQVDGSAFSFRQNKSVKDARGQKLFTIQHKLLSIHSTYQGIDPTSGSVLFTVKSSLSFGTKLTATFKNLAGDGRDHELVLRGDLLDRSAEITTEGGVPVARISRSFANAGEIFFDNQTYIVTVAPGVDAALLLAICICLDEKANEKN
ncbi:hypothetical protein FFLO_01593 [Filobasidium floriforme]|uniref:Uncharacterized protein n=1 Tax=Filobasidium floriforme TaxID=5210 RepID=A0A8K0JQN7_9TREE|nr:tubby C-terminal-like domain-containing protein [Filobasidium floriforme]KAG7562903.1 hypothetical protein FFLO_01593 [Filobasidium floriforme]KAH8080648.1 tubby C-terminal-like domain-containing protein [Filobasidium floriforme]